jgi:hypothetical protein
MGGNVGDTPGVSIENSGANFFGPMSSEVNLSMLFESKKTAFSFRSFLMKGERSMLNIIHRFPELGR